MFKALNDSGMFKNIGDNNLHHYSENKEYREFTAELNNGV